MRISVQFSVPITDHHFLLPILLLGTHTITAYAQGPAANAGPDQTVFVEELVTLDGSGSTGAGPLSYQWTILTQPQATFRLENPDATNPFFSSAFAGSFSFELTITDIHGNIDSDQVTVNVITFTPVINEAMELALDLGRTGALSGSRAKALHDHLRKIRMTLDHELNLERVIREFHDFEDRVAFFI